MKGMSVNEKKFFAWIFLVINILLIFNLIRDIIWFSRADERIEKTQSQLETLRHENFRLKQEKAYRESGEFIETQIRDKLGMTKPGEYVVLLPEEVKQQVDKVEKTESDLANWEKWLKLFTD